ncbi:RpiB/LacA/LacB family sugar-phosphate isomerase [Faecalicatena sp. AGMB00832]|uniref:RpiB/LacA/LacB family sugar-phosphate isomerase n=1 Tax=Faecalicatena faecalis TaxID=2726362 RepID=A0ABS6D1V0_9FIRM|nr:MULTISPECIES: RpiB/LacA/LacB family sugar-phosphate isomerase [Faecalicatena]MBU3875172.1 RpiB/LacA/LacB family sugar-phosphate isomerase [Faecalicatena faecalis]MCI6467801.1 RpiB/LacA/LacB family sugar-phosphate isomerase [Faecalicatena sp.]MDY5619557.1 RpiB/LacA/LacB family sugar-phosphate isomerase [Lachnospiraceae bacterium]
MKIAVVMEGSTKFQNPDVIRVLGEFDHEILNLGMKNIEGEPDLTYMETALISALALNLGIVDFVVGGCGTGQGYMNAVLQYPNVACGLIYDPVEAFLFSQVNAGNCISLPLNKGYGKVNGDINLRYIFEKLFNDTYGQGYPAVRGELQKKARMKLAELSATSHYTMEEILVRMDLEIVKRACAYPGVLDTFKKAPESSLKETLLSLVEA